MVLSLAGKGLGQGRLAASGFAGQKDDLTLAGQRQTQVAVQAHQFGLAGDERADLAGHGAAAVRRQGWRPNRRHHRRIDRRGPGRRGHCPGADVLIESHGFGRWLDAELFGQDATAAFILGQGAHQVAVGVFVPRLMSQQLPGVVGGRPIAAGGLGVGDQCPPRGDGCLTQARPLGQHPFIEKRRVAGVEAVHEVATIEGHGPRQLAHIGPLGDALLELGHVEPIVRRAVEGQRGVMDRQVGREAGFQAADDLAQIGLGDTLGHIGPEETGQPEAFVGPAGDGQIAEQCLALL